MTNNEPLPADDERAVSDDDALLDVIGDGGNDDLLDNQNDDRLITMLLAMRDESRRDER